MRALEERGIGRPSTYASIIGTILDRGYVARRARRSCPRSSPSPSSACSSSTSRGSSTTSSRARWRTTSTASPPATRSAARGCAASTSATSDGDAGPQAARPDLGASTRARSARSRSGNDIELRVGRYGPYLERDGQRANDPADLAPDELTIEKAEELLAQPSSERELGVDPETGLEIVVQDRPLRPVRDRGAPRTRRRSRAPARSSSRCRPRRVTLEDALQLLTLPRVRRCRPPTARRSSRTNGRYGPYVKKGTETRSLESEEQLLTITLDEALVVLAQPKQRRGAAAAEAAARESSAPTR